MAEYCICQIVGNFPIINVGITSASLRINQSVSITEGDPAIPLYGPAHGDLAITGYAPLPDGEIPECPGKVNVSFQWEQKTECDWEPDSPTIGMIITHFIPRGRAKSSVDGTATNQFSFETIYSPHVLTSFNASASSGPATPYFLDVHRDVYNLVYTGGPIPVGVDDQYNLKDISYLFESVNGVRLFPEGTKFYLATFSWEYTPPNIPTTSYSFLVSYDGG